MKKLLIGIGALALIIGAHFGLDTANATSCITAQQGGTGLCSGGTAGQSVIVLSTNPLVLGFGAPSGGGSTTTFNNIATSTLLIKAGAGVGAVSSTDGTGQAIITISATGGASSTIVTGVLPIVVNQVGINATTSCPTCITSAVQTLFGLSTSSISISTGTQASTFTVTSTGGNTIKIIIPSNVAFFSNDAGYLTGNQTITLTGAVTGSGATSISTTYTTSTLYSLFSGTGPIVFNTSTGGISFVNPGYLTAAITSINGNSTAAQTFTGGTGISVASAGGNTTTTNTGVTSVIAGGCVTVSNATGTVTFGSTCLTGTKVDSLNSITGPTVIAGGTGIGVSSSSQTITVTNNGVTTFNGLTGSTAYNISCVSGCTVTTTTTSGAITVTGGGLATTTPYMNGNLTVSSGTALSTFTGSLCGGSTFQNGISASGTALCGTPSGGSSSTNVFGTNGVTTTQSGVNATATLDTTYAASWSALETFLKGTTINGTTTLASTTNALVLTNGSGTVLAYAGSSCGGGQAPNGFSATGTVTGCLTFLTANQTITLTGAVTGSGATTIATTFTTSTLYGLFSAGTGISFGSTNGLITNTGVTSFTGAGCVTSPNTTGTIMFAVTCITSSTANGLYLQIANNFSDLNNSSTARQNLGLKATSSLAVADSNGIQTSYGGSSCTNQGVSGISATGTVTCTTFATSTSSGGTGNLFVTPTSSVLANNVVAFQSSASSTVKATSSIYALNNGDVTLGSSSDNGLFSIVNASGTPVVKVSSTTNPTSSAVLLDLQATSSVFQILASGHINATGTVPSMGTCGTSPSVVGNDAAGTITIGSGVVTSCTLNFAIPYESSNISVLESDNSTAVTGDVTSITTSSVTFGFSATLGGGKLYYMVMENL